MSGKILVTPRSITLHGHPQLERLKEAGFEIVFSTPGKQPTEEQLLQLIPDCDGYLAGVEKISAQVLRAATKLKIIARNGAGIDNVDLETAKELKIEVCRAAGANARGVAELAIGLLLSVARSVPFSDQTIKAHGWSRRTGIELEGKTLGVIGCGKIGKLVSQLALAMGMKVLAYDVYVDTSFAPANDFRFATLDEIINKSDALTLHCPPLASGKPLLDSDAFKRMKKGIIIINTARSDLIDRDALAAAIEGGTVFGAATDVFDHEPPENDPLLQNNRVIATPHVGALTNESVDRAVEVAVDHLLKHLAKGTACVCK